MTEILNVTIGRGMSECNFFNYPLKNKGLEVLLGIKEEPGLPMYF